MRRIVVAIAMVCLGLLLIPAIASAISFNPPPAGPTTGVGEIPQWVETGDFDEDGRDDVAVAASANSGDDEGLYIALSDGDGSFTVSEESPLQAPVFEAGDKDMSSVRSADLDGDGHLDLLAAISGASSFVTYLGDGGGDFAYHGRTFAQQGYMGSSAALGDVTDDGVPDLIIGYYGSRYSVTEGDGEGGFVDVGGMVTVPGTPGNLLDGLSEIAIGDYDGDGEQDLALGLLPCEAGSGPSGYCTDPDPSMNSVFVVAGDNSGSFDPVPGGNPHMLAGGDEARLSAMTTADLDGDARDDLVVTSDNGQVQTFLGATTGFLTNNPDSNATLDTGSQPDWIQVANLDLDEKRDLAWLNRGSSNFGAAFGSGSGFLTATGSPFGSNGAYLYRSLATGDFDGDGFDDFAATNAGSEASLVTLMNSPRISGDAVEFADQPVGTTSAPEAITIENVEAPDAVLSNIEIVGTDADQFDGVDLETCKKSIAGEQTCDVKVSFAPNEPGSMEAAIEVTYNGSEPAEIPVTGFATSTEIEVEPGDLGFGEIELEAVPPTRSVIVRSTGNAPLSIGDLTITGPDATGFSFVDDGCSSQAIEPGQTCNVTLRMATGSPGPKSAQLQIPSDAESGTVTRNLNGRVIEPPASDPDPPTPEQPGQPGQPEQPEATLKLKSAGKVKPGKKLKVTAIVRNTGSTTITGLTLKTSLPKKIAKLPKVIKAKSVGPGATVKKTIRIAVRKKAHPGKKLKVTVTVSAGGQKLAAKKRTVKIKK